MTFFQTIYFFHLNTMTTQLLHDVTMQLLINPCSSTAQSEGFLYLQERPVLRLLLLHLLQQPLDFFSQLCLQLWLDDKVQCGGKRRAQRVNMALQKIQLS